jgi:hypothetical protein
MRRIAALLAALLLAVSQPAFADVSVGNGSLPQLCTSWTPTDVSGASLPLTPVGTQYYCKTGMSAFVQINVTYPTNASGSAAAISLPVTCQTANTAWSVTSNYTTALGVTASGTSVFINSPTSFSGVANVTLATFQVRISGMCQTTT